MFGVGLPELPLDAESAAGWTLQLNSMLVWADLAG
jgi:hypothetical protein